MGTSASNRFTGQPDAFCTGTTSAGNPLVVTATKDALFTRTADGIYVVTTTQNFDAAHCKVDVDVDAANPTVQVVHTSATVKTINVFTGSTGVALAPTRIAVTIKKLLSP